MKMKKETGMEEIRWQVVKAMIDEYSALACPNITC
jgi:hypothetical protein